VSPTVDTNECLTIEHNDTLMNPIFNFLQRRGCISSEKKEEKAIRIKVSRFLITGGNFLKKRFIDTLSKMHYTITSQVLHGKTTQKYM